MIDSTLIEATYSFRGDPKDKSRIVLRVPDETPIVFEDVTGPDSSRNAVSKVRNTYVIDIDPASIGTVRARCCWDRSLSTDMVYPYHFLEPMIWPTSMERLAGVTLTGDVEGNSLLPVCGVSADRQVAMTILEEGAKIREIEAVGDISVLIGEDWEDRGTTSARAHGMSVSALTFLSNCFVRQPVGRVLIRSRSAQSTSPLILEIGSRPFRRASADWFKTAEMICRLSWLWWGGCTHVYGARGGVIQHGIRIALAGRWVRREIGAREHEEWLDGQLERLGYAPSGTGNSPINSTVERGTVFARHLHAWIERDDKAMSALDSILADFWGSYVREEWVLERLSRAGFVGDW